MSGHNKWSKIKRKKAVEDQKRGKIFSQLVQEIRAVVKERGEDLETNSALRKVVDRAREENMPKSNIEKAIARGMGRDDAGRLKEVIYEAYGPGGGALLIEAQTDNKNRTAQEIKRILQEYGITLGGAGSVQWMFKEGVQPTILKLEEEEFAVFKKIYSALNGHEDVSRVLTNIEEL